MCNTVHSFRARKPAHRMLYASDYDQIALFHYQHALIVCKMIESAVTEGSATLPILAMYELNFASYES